MTSEPTKVESLVLEHLRHIRAQVDQQGLMLREVRDRVGHVELQVASLHTQYANLSVRSDRIEDRLERIEKRLELQDA